MADEIQNGIDIRVMSNIECSFCKSEMKLMQIVPKPLGTRFCFTCENCGFIGRKLITDKYSVKEEPDKCVITYIGNKN